VFNSGILADPVPGASFDYQPAPPGLVERAQRIRTVCQRHGLPIGAAALAFTLRHPAVTAAVVGARTAAEIAEDAGYLSIEVPDSLFAELAAEGLLGS
jgi:D-threo-aldose 1-dehydrogenase